MPTPDDLRKAILAAIGKAAPEADLDALPGDEDIRDELDLDSMDIHDYIVALHESTGIDVPEVDYGRMTTVDGAVEYLLGKAG